MSVGNLAVLQKMLDGFAQQERDAHATAKGKYAPQIEALQIAIALLPSTDCTIINNGNTNPLGSTWTDESVAPSANEDMVAVLDSIQQQLPDWCGSPHLSRRDASVHLLADPGIGEGARGDPDEVSGRRALADRQDPGRRAHMKQLFALAILVVAVDALAIVAVPAAANWLDRSGIQKLPPQYDHGRPI